MRRKQRDGHPASGNGQSMNSEKNAIKRVQNGDAASFEQLVETYGRPLFVLARNLLQDEAMANDLVQDTFLAAFANMGSFDPEKGRFAAWLYAIARNKCFNARKKARETPVTDMERIPGSDDLERQCGERELFARLDGALAGLPDRDRAVFVLAEIQELPLAEVAEIEGVPVGTVKSRLWRVKRKLGRLLGEYAR